MEIFKSRFSLRERMLSVKNIHTLTHKTNLFLWATTFNPKKIGMMYAKNKTKKRKK